MTASYKNSHTASDRVEQWALAGSFVHGGDNESSIPLFSNIALLLRTLGH